MAMPKNNSTKDYVLAGMSALGGLMSAYAAYAGPGFNATLPASWAVNFVVIAFGLYAVGFFLVPGVLIDMNFVANQDAYHPFLGRFSGYTMCVLCYTIWKVLPQRDAYFIGMVWATGCSLVGPTYAALYLTPKQTPEGHLPAHLLFLVGGIISILTVF